MKEAPEIPTEHPQWEMSDDEDDGEKSAGSESEFTTDDEDEQSDRN